MLLLVLGCWEGRKRYLPGKKYAVEIPPKEYSPGITALQGLAQCKSLLPLGSPVMLTTGKPCSTECFLVYIHNLIIPHCSQCAKATKYATERKNALVLSILQTTINIIDCRSLLMNNEYCAVLRSSTHRCSSHINS